MLSLDLEVILNILNKNSKLERTSKQNKIWCVLLLLRTTNTSTNKIFS